MLPTLWPGDLLTIRSLRAEEAEPGQIVLYMRHDRFFIHRVVSKNLSGSNASLITRGDGMAEDDPPIGNHELLGAVAEVRRSGSVFLPARKLTRFRRVVAWLFCHWNLFRRIGLRLWNYRHSMDGRVDATFLRAA